MKELIEIINSKFFSVIDELKAQKETLEAKLNTIKEDIEKKVTVASEYKEKVENSNNIISGLEKDIEKLQNDLKELHEKFDAAGFTELLEAGNKEINGKIIENNTKIQEEQDNIKALQEEASNLKDELVTLKDSRDNIDNALNNTIVALTYYNAKTDEMTIFATENFDKLDEFTPEDDSLDMTSPEDDVDVNKIIDGKIFEEIDNISNDDQELTDQELENILNGANEEEEKEEVVETPEEKLSTLDDVIDVTNKIITNEISEEPVEEVKEEVKAEEKPELPDDIEEIVVDEDINPPVATTIESSDNEEVLKELGFDTTLFSEDINKIGPIDKTKADKIKDVLDVHFIDINNIYQHPSILVTMDADTLAKELEILEYAGCIPTTINYIFKYLDKIDVSKLEEKITGSVDSIITVLASIIPDLEIKDIGDELGLNQQEREMLKSRLTEEELLVMNAFADVVKVNYNTLKGLEINELNKCFTEHPKRFMLNPDQFDAILDKYDPSDLVRCINKNVAVIDKL